MADWTSDTIPKNIMETLVVDDLAVNYEISAGTIQAKNAATAWVNFNGTTTPPTIRDSYNVSDVVRTATGDFDVYFEEGMDNVNFVVSGSCIGSVGSASLELTNLNKASTLDTCSFSATYATNTKANASSISIQIFGGKK